MKLSNQQQQIVDSDERVMMIIAGPGSGKTQVLTKKVLHALSRGADESSILLLTFTNKAANNMLDRIERQLGRRPKITGGTFHHVANLFIRQNAKSLGYSPNYSIIDEADSVRLLRKVLKEEYVNELKSLPKVELLHKMFSFCRNSLSSLSDYLELHLKSHRKETLLIGRVYDSYSNRKRSGNMLDFDDLLQLFSKLLDDVSFREKMRAQYSHVFVDEFQDTNKLQFEIVRKLHKDGNNLFVVGDDCQSIYSFRAAEIMNMLRFQVVFLSVKMFYLTENYRSTKQIVSLINDIIRRNRNKFEKRLDSVRHDAVKMVPEVVIYDDARNEARAVAQEIRALLDSKTLPEEIAVLYRSNFQSAHMEVELTKKGVRYVKLGGLKFFEQSHIKDVTAFLKILGGMIDELAWERMLKMFEGIGDKTAKKIFADVKFSPDSLAAIKNSNEKKLAVLANLIALAEKKNTPAEKAEVFMKGGRFSISFSCTWSSAMARNWP
jgi:DNA helicase-2/ATP-dependent DNA helicase PcrA